MVHRHESRTYVINNIKCGLETLSPLYQTKRCTRSCTYLNEQNADNIQKRIKIKLNELLLILVTYVGWTNKVTYEIRKLPFGNDKQKLFILNLIKKKEK